MSDSKVPKLPTGLIPIENWSVHQTLDPYRPPEMAATIVLVGIVQDVDGNQVKICSSAIRWTKGLKITCKDHDFLLGQIDANYERWLKETDQWKNFDPANPIRMVRELSPEGKAATVDEAGRQLRSN